MTASLAELDNVESRVETAERTSVKVTTSIAGSPISRHRNRLLVDVLVFLTRRNVLFTRRHFFLARRHFFLARWNLLLARRHFFLARRHVLLDAADLDVADVGLVPALIVRRVEVVERRLEEDVGVGSTLDDHEIIGGKHADPHDPEQIAALMGLPSVTFAKEIHIDGDTVSVQRQTEAGYDEVHCPLPALVSVTAGVVEPRYPSFKGIMAAKSKPVDELKVADLGLDASQVGAAGAGQEIIAVEDAPAREAGEIIEDDGETFQKIVEYLEGVKVL